MLVCLVMVSAVAWGQEPTTVYVSPSGDNSWDGLSPTFTSGTNGPKATIQAAIDAANSGDIINVAAGTYNETVTVNKNITLTGSGTPTIQNLTMNPGPLTLGGNFQVSGTLTFTSGNITTGADTLILGTGGAVVRTSGHVVGNFTKSVATGPTLLTFEIGDATDYTPVNLSFASVTTSGNLTASTTVGDHPDISSSIIDPAKSVNRYWTLTNRGIVFTTYNATFNFVADDKDPGTNTNNFIIGKCDGGSWTVPPTIGTRTTTSTQALGMTTLSDYQVGEPAGPLLVFAPHPDDEAITGGGSIRSAVLQGRPAYVVVATNGDYNTGTSYGYTRQGESVSGMALLGLSEDKIYFLGYPDGWLLVLRNNYPSSDRFYTTSTEISATYGTRGYGGKDVHSAFYGTPASYNWPNFVNDLATVIRTILPSQIIVTGPLDAHPDHRAVYYALWEAVSAVASTNPGWHVTVGQTIVHAPASYPFNDTWDVNESHNPIGEMNLSKNDVWPEPTTTQVLDRFDPSPGFSEPPDFPSSEYLWPNRVSVPVPQEMRSTDRSLNLKYQAIQQYVTQLETGPFVNAFCKLDEFWWLETLGIPRILYQPLNKNVSVGDTALLRVVAVGRPPLSYQWQKNGVNITEATSASYTTPPTTLADNGSTFRCVVTNSLGSTTSNAATLAVAPTLPVINVWYGHNQRFGQLGIPQQAINILGNVSSPHGIASLTYSLNGGPSVALSRGPDTRRLRSRGDFNADINYSSLIDGMNQVVIAATDSLGPTKKDTVIVQYTSGHVWPLPYSIDWSSTDTIPTVAQIVDGLWTVQGGRLRPAVTGYDRLVAIGDVTWTGYEVTVPITIHSIDSVSGNYSRDGSGLGFVMRWNGHTDNPWPGWQPKTGYLPIGADGWYDAKPSNPMLKLEGNGYSLSSTPRALNFEVTYDFKMRVETISGQGSFYKFKVWQFGQPEPTGWDLTGQVAPADPASGSLLLAAHNVDASFGNVTVTPVLPDTTPSPAMSTITAAPTSISANGTSTSTITVQLKNASGVNLTGGSDTVTLSTTAGTLSAVTNPGNGTRIATLTSSTVPGTATISGTVNGAPIVSTATVSFVTGSDHSSLVSDEFNEGSLDTSVWTFVNPRGDATLTMTGSQVSISVPSGVQHDAWNNVNTVPRIVQSVNNADFDIELKFDAAMTQQYQTEGVQVLQDGANYLRFEFHSAGGNIKIFAATCTDSVSTAKVYNTIAGNGSAPLYMRVTRAGNQWTQSYSLNGLNWMVGTTFPYSLSVGSVAPYVGNAEATPGANPPGFTGLIDYFITMSNSIAASASGPGTITPSGTVLVNRGTDTTFTITSNAGAHIDSVVVDGTNLGGVTTHTFTNVTTNHTIAAYFSPFITANLKAYLQGPYATSGDSMRTTLRQQGLLPLHQPYNVAPWSYSGTESVASVPDSIVDWVLVELRTPDWSAASKVATRAAFIKRAGRIVDLDGTSPVTFSGLASGNYYVVVRHRNHLAVMSASAVALSASSSLYDFTGSQNAAYSSDYGLYPPMKDLGNGKFGMYAGDVNGDGTVYYLGSGNDRGALLVEIGGSVNGTASGYISQDTNLDGSAYYLGPSNDRGIILVAIGGSVNGRVYSGLPEVTKP